MTQASNYSDEVRKNLELVSQDRDYLGLSNVWVRESIRHKYAYGFTWLGRPIMQIPQDIYAIQEIIWEVQPDLIIETGIAHGGSLILSASLLALLDFCNMGKIPAKSNRCVIGIDIEIRPHNRKAIQAHPLSKYIEMYEGSSISPEIVKKVKERAKDFKKIVLFFDSNHSHKHVLAELKAYAMLTSVGSYCVVWDTGIEDLPEDFYPNRPWGKGNNPKTAVDAFLKNTDSFIIDKSFNYRLMITASQDGFLKRIK